MAAKEKVIVTLGLDVEEEGLFSGSYACLAPPVRNTVALPRLTPLLERGLKPTFFCAHSVLADRPSRMVLEKMRDRHGVEIGCHLHHWNTPPLKPQPDGHIPAIVSSVPASNVAPELLAAKFKTLFNAALDFQGAPITSFRMGRWDLLRCHWHLLRENGVLCDASVRPLHRVAVFGPNHFAAPADPYLACAEGQGIVEIPLTATPLIRAFGQGPQKMPRAIAEKFQCGLKNWGALVLLPVEHPLWLMRLTSSAHIRSGGKVLSLAWHSSEMMPGCAPHMPDQESVDGFLHKMEKYLDWLESAFEVVYLNMEGIGKTLKDSLPCPIPAAPCDWSCMEKPAAGDAVC